MSVPYSSPITFTIRADASIFKDLVQILTGQPDDPTYKSRRRATVSRWSPFKLQERRKRFGHDLEISKREIVELSGSSTRSNGFSSPGKGSTMPVKCDAEEVGAESSLSGEERAIAEKGFYLHESPMKVEPPVLLTLFPLTSSKPEL